MSGASWLSYLQPATWRGLVFSVLSSEVVSGRKWALHDYPFKDDVWAEDIGQKAPVITFRGFLVGDDCYTREMAFISAAKTKGDGTLVHPTLGSMQVSLLEFSSGQDAERGRVVSLNFRFIRGQSSPLYPSITVSTGDAVDDSADDADDAAAGDYSDDIAGPAVFGDLVTESSIQTVGAFVSEITAALSDAGLIAGAVAGLVPPPGFTYGRYAAGGLTALQAGVTTVPQALALTTASIATVQALAADAEVLSASITPAIAPGMQALTEGIRTSAIAPTDQVRLLSDLAAFSPPAIPSIAPVGGAIFAIVMATSAICRRAALTSLARACASYQPSSYNDAIALRQSAAALFDAEILIAANADDVATYQALRALRSTVVLDLNTRAATLPALIEVTSPMPQPAPAIAWRLYADATRMDDLIARANPIHPAFMPVDFVALSA